MRHDQHWLKSLARGERILRARGYKKRSELDPTASGMSYLWAMTDEEWAAAVKRVARTPRSCSCHQCKRYGGVSWRAKLVERDRVKSELEELAEADRERREIRRRLLFFYPGAHIEQLDDDTWSVYEAYDDTHLDFFVEKVENLEKRLDNCFR